MVKVEAGVTGHQNPGLTEEDSLALRRAFLKTRSRVVYFCIVVPGGLCPEHRRPLVTIC